MALFNEVSPGSAVNVSTMVGAEIRNLTRDGTSLSFEYRAYIYQNTTTYSWNTWALWIENTQYNVKSDDVQSSRGVKYYTPWRSASKEVPSSAESTTINVGVNGNLWYPTSPDGTVALTLSGLPIASAPSVSELTVSDISDKGVTASFIVTNSNNSTIISNEIQFSLTDFGTVIKTISDNSGNITDLDSGRTYYVRGKSVNGVGATYTSSKSFTTSYINPGNPGVPVLTYDLSQPTLDAKLKATWTSGSSGSNPISGYRIKLYKNNVEIFTIDTESTITNYTFNSFTSLGFSVGDTAQVGVYAYSKDYNNNKHFSSQTTSSIANIISDKFIYLSQNGSSFEKKKIHISVNGGSFIEIKKEKLKVIK